MKMLTAIVLLLLLPPARPADAQRRPRSDGRCLASTSINRVIDAYYRLISGPAGSRDWDEFTSLFLPTARLDAVGIDERGENHFIPQSKEEYVRHVGAYIREKGFFQSEVKRTTRCYARIGHVFSTYESRNEPGGRVIDRGVFSFQLVYEREAWKIAHVTWNSETSAYPVPKEFLR
jgi:hypothetical protein